MAGVEFKTQDLVDLTKKSGIHSVSRPEAEAYVNRLFEMGAIKVSRYAAETTWEGHGRTETYYIFDEQG